MLETIQDQTHNQQPTCILHFKLYGICSLPLELQYLSWTIYLDELIRFHQMREK